MNKTPIDSTKHYIEKVEDEAWSFEKITLKEMDGVKLMDRVDVKYLIPLNVLPLILDEAKPLYRMQND
jgi:hypothetical protein